MQAGIEHVAADVVSASATCIFFLGEPGTDRGNTVAPQPEDTRMVNVAELSAIDDHFRHLRVAIEPKMIIDRGELGDIYHARVFWLRRNGIPRIGSWFTQKKYAGGGCAYDIGGHMLDACLHLMKDFEVESVSA